MSTIKMAWTEPNSLPTYLLSGNLSAIFLALLVALSLPILLHYVLYATSSSSASPPTFLLLGPSGGGKTSLLTLLERRSTTNSAQEKKLPPQTHTSSTPQTSVLALPSSIPIASNRYRSSNDPTLSSQQRTKYQIMDTPGHGKLRDSLALSHLTSPSPITSNICGLIFVIDSASTLDDEGLRDAASYLHDVLLILQKLKNGKLVTSMKKGGKAKQDIPVLIAANKQDLFTALPPSAIREKLEAEVERVRKSRSKGLLEPGMQGREEEDDVLGGNEGEGKFGFKMLEEVGVRVEVVGGAVRAEGGGPGIRRWEEWIGGCL